MCAYTARLLAGLAERRSLFPWVPEVRSPSLLPTAWNHSAILGASCLPRNSAGRNSQDNRAGVLKRLRQAKRHHTCQHRYSDAEGQAIGLRLRGNALGTLPLAVI